MGNCVFRGFGEIEQVIKVVNVSGGIMELYAPITAECITNEFPGHGIFRRDVVSRPLLHNEELLVGELYYLLPLDHCPGGISSRITGDDVLVSGLSSSVAPYRMSFDNHGLDVLPRISAAQVFSRWKKPEMEVFPAYHNAGVWKVKLVISPEQLTEILSEEAHTEALIESVRTVAKCGNGFASAANSDQWSVSSSWKPSSVNII